MYTEGKKVVKRYIGDREIDLSYMGKQKLYTNESSEPLPPIERRGLFAEYRFNEGSGQILTDYISGNNGVLGANGGVDTNDPTWSAQGLQFNNSYVNLNNTIRDCISKNKSFAIELVLQAISGTVFASSIASADRFGISASSGVVTVGIFNGTTYIANRRGTLGAGYQHILYQFDASTQTGLLYVNKTVQNNTQELSLNSTAIARFGASTSGVNPYSGTIAWANIYNIGDITTQELSDSYADLKARLSARSIFLP